MAIYLLNGQVNLSQDGGSDTAIVIVDGNSWGGGKRVAEWTSVTTSAGWLGVEYYSEEYDDETGNYLYEFDILFNPNTTIQQKSAVCYLNYILEDGTVGSGSFIIYQGARNNIDVIPPYFKTLLYNPDELVEKTVEIRYDGINSIDDVDTPVVNGPFRVLDVNGGLIDTDKVAIEYIITPLYYNVGATDITGGTRFSFTLPSTSVVHTEFIYFTQYSARFPFGIKMANGAEIPYVSSTNKLKIIRDLPAASNTVNLKCNFPYIKDGTVPTVTVSDSYNSNVIVKRGGGDLDDGLGIEEQISITLSRNTDTYQRLFDVVISYVTPDDVTHTDKVRLHQVVSDGSDVTPEIITKVESMRFLYDGTASIYNYVDVNWFGKFTTSGYTKGASWVTVGSPTLQESSGIYNKTYRYPISVSQNTSNVERSTTITFTGSTSSGNVSKSVTITQTANQKVPILKPTIPTINGKVVSPIWKDVEYNFGNVDTVDYAIYKNDTPIFISRSCKRPNKTNNTILVNKICQNYLDVPEFSPTSDVINGNYGEFKLTDAAGGVVYNTYKFVNDWSYSDNFITGSLSHPILNDNTVYKGQYLPFTVFAAGESISLNYGIRYKNSTATTYSSTIYDNVSTVVFPQKSLVDGLDNAKSLYIENVEYPLSNCGVDYVLYYVNPWGGYDSFPIKGKVIETDELTQYAYTQNYNNTTIQFGKKRYLSEIHKKFKLNTHWLREDESSRMWYLIQSNTVYLHNIKTQEIHPIIITNTTQEHKKRGMLSNRISYQIECELSQTRERL